MNIFIIDECQIIYVVILGSSTCLPPPGRRRGRFAVGR
jgi:hypothetical protein